jgi:Domain of unknown function (DUF1963)
MVVAGVATFEISGLEGWKSRVGLWGSVGLICACVGHPPAGAVVIAILFGGAAGAASIALVVWNRARFTRLLPFLGIALTIACVLAIYQELNVLSWLSLGSFSVVAEILCSVVLGKKAAQRFNERYGAVLELFESSAKKTSRSFAPDPPSAEICEAFIEELPEVFRAEARDAMQPVIMANAFRSIEVLPVGHSALSGTPLLDRSQSWPEKDGRPLEFLCQINFADLPPTDHVRPAAGLLAVFYDAEEGAWGFDEGDLGSCAFLYQPEIGLTQPVLKPGSGKHAPLRKPLRFERTRGFTPTREFEGRIHELIEQNDGATAGRIDDLYQTLQECGPYGGHRVLSRPLLVQCDMDGELSTANRAHDLPEGTHWTLLLQLDSDKDLGWCWGDAGCLYFWIPTDDLAIGRFDRPWVVLQCY